MCLWLNAATACGTVHLHACTSAAGLLSSCSIVFMAPLVVVGPVAFVVFILLCPYLCLFALLSWLLCVCVCLCCCLDCCV